jgi:hypothetical protein
MYSKSLKRQGTTTCNVCTVETDGSVYGRGISWVATTVSFSLEFHSTELSIPTHPHTHISIWKAAVISTRYSKTFIAHFVVLRARETLISSIAVLPSGCVLCDLCWRSAQVSTVWKCMTFLWSRHVPHREQYLSLCRNHGNPDVLVTHSHQGNCVKIYIVYC